MSDFIIYVCPECGRTVKQPNPSSYQVDPFCFHGDHYEKLTWIYPPPEEKSLTEKSNLA